MVIVLALGIITLRANGNKYPLRLDLKAERAFIYQQRLSGVKAFTGAVLQKQRDRCRSMMSEGLTVFLYQLPLISKISKRGQCTGKLRALLHRTPLKITQ